MLGAIGRVVAELRSRGVRVSTAEAIDASRAARIVGVTSRRGLRDALGATLAKGRQEREVFREVFDRVFARPGGAGRGKRRKKDTARSEAGAGSAGGGRGSPRREPSSPPRAAGPPSGRPRTAVAQRRPSAPGRPVPLALRGGRLRRIVAAKPLHERDVPSAIGGVRKPAASPREGMLRADLSGRMSLEEEMALSGMVARLVEEIRLRPSRRVRRASKGTVWPRGMLRASLGTGGVPFEIPVRSRKPRRPRVVLLVDVSWSVARAAGLFVQIAMRLLAAGRRTRVFVFVDRPVEATEPLARWARADGTLRSDDPRPRTRPVRAGAHGRAPGSGVGLPVSGVSFRSLLAAQPGLELDAPSDYGRTLYALERMLRPGGGDAVLVILGDGRVNRFDPLEWAFEDLARRFRRVIWLVPEPRARWGEGDSALPDYLPHCDVAVEAHDLEGLTRGVREMLRML